MTNEQKPTPRRALMKPFEVVGVSALFGLFVFFITVYTLKDWTLGFVLGGIAIVIVLLVLALLLLSYKPNPDAPVYLDRFDADKGAGGDDEKDAPHSSL